VKALNAGRPLASMLLTAAGCASRMLSYSCTAGADCVLPCACLDLILRQCGVLAGSQHWTSPGLAEHQCKQ
jgi:hypothetical protein